MEALTHKGKRRQAIDVPDPDPNAARAQRHAFIATAHALADRAGAVILPHFRTGTTAHNKGGADFDPVTEADRGAEAAIREAIGEAYPDHGIVGEEFGSERADAQLCWIIDPIDGTRAFIMGQPLWGTLIGLTDGGAPLIGLLDQPYMRERFWSGETQSFFARDGEPQPIKTRSCASLDGATLASTSPDMFEGADRERFESLTANVKLRRFGGDCYNYGLLAMGEVDLVVEAGLKPFDILPLVPIVERAGGIVSTWEGGDPREGGRIIAAGDPVLHERALRILSG